jgi:ABC-2 type transport system permease protein
MGRMWNLASKDLKILLRDKAALFWVFMFPLLIGMMFGFIFGGEGGGMSPSKIAVIDADGSKESKALVDRLKKSSAVKVTETSLDAGLKSVRKGDISAYVLVPKGFGEASQRFQAGEKPIKIGSDPSRKAEAGMLQGVIAEAAYADMQKKFSDPVSMQASAKDALAELDKASDMPADQKENLKGLLSALDKYGASGAATGPGGQAGMQGPKIETENVAAEGAKPASAFEVTFPQALLWGVLAVVATFAISMVQEREKGTLVRLRVSPMSFSEILGGKALACFFACMGTMVVLLAFGVLLFHIRIGSPGLLLLALVASSICLVGVMMLLSVLGRTEQAVSGSSWGVLMICAMFGGGMLPVFVMPGWMQTAGSFSPLKWTIVSIEGSIWRGYTLADMLLPVSVLVGIGVVCFSIGVRVLARARD